MFKIKGGEDDSFFVFQVETDFFLQKTQSSHKKGSKFSRNFITKKRESSERVPYEPKNILITGGAGFIASHVAILFAKKYPHCKVSKETLFFLVFFFFFVVVVVYVVVCAVFRFFFLWTATLLRRGRLLCVVLRQTGSIRFSPR